MVALAQRYRPPRMLRNERWPMGGRASGGTCSGRSRQDENGDRLPGYFPWLKIGHTETAPDRAKVLRPAYPFGGAIGPLEGRVSTFRMYSRWVGGRAGTAVPRGAVCELPNPPKKTCQSSIPGTPTHPSWGRAPRHRACIPRARLFPRPLCPVRPGYGRPC